MSLLLSAFEPEGQLSGGLRTLDVWSSSDRTLVLAVERGVARRQWLLLGRTSAAVYAVEGRLGTRAWLDAVLEGDEAAVSQVGEELIFAYPTPGSADDLVYDAVHAHVANAVDHLPTCRVSLDERDVAELLQRVEDHREARAAAFRSSVALWGGLVGLSALFGCLVTAVALGGNGAALAFVIVATSRWWAELSGSKAALGASLVVVPVGLVLGALFLPLGIGPAAALMAVLWGWMLEFRYVLAWQALGASGSLARLLNLRRLR